MEVRRLIIDNIDTDRCGLSQQSLLHEPHIFYDSEGERRLCIGVDGEVYCKDDLVVRVKTTVLSRFPCVITVEYFARIIPSRIDIYEYLQKFDCNVEEEGDYVHVTNIPPLDGYEEIFPGWEVWVMKGLEYNCFNAYITDFYGEFGSRALVLEILENEGYENVRGM